MSIKSVILYCKLPEQIFWNCTTNTNWKINWMLRFSGVAIYNIQIIHFCFSVKYPYGFHKLLKYQFYLFYILRFYARSHKLSIVNLNILNVWESLLQSLESSRWNIMTVLGFPFLHWSYVGQPSHSEPAFISALNKCLFSTTKFELIG